MKRTLPLFVAAVLAGCGKTPATNESSMQGEVASSQVVAPAASSAPSAPAAPTVSGFDAMSAPVATPTLGGWPYFSLIDGYVDMTAQNSSGDSSKEYLRDSAFDEYEVFDGIKLIRLEGRLSTRRANGRGASFFEAKKTYERLVRERGGVTVFEGSGKAMKALKLTFADRRHRAYYVDYDEMGVYMIRMPDRQLWVEVYKPYNTAADNYWLTVVEVQTMKTRASVLPAEEMKRALEADGRVALYVNFDTDRAAIRPDSAPLVDEIAKLLNGSPELDVHVDGHTDAAGTPARNRALAQERARAVVAALVASGITAARLNARGFGADKPLAPNDDEAGRAQNRRVELVRR